MNISKIQLPHKLIYLHIDGIYRNKTQKRVTAINRELPPPNEQFLFDFEQIQTQFPVSLLQLHSNDLIFKLTASAG